MYKLQYSSSTNPVKDAFEHKLRATTQVTIACRSVTHESSRQHKCIRVHGNKTVITKNGKQVHEKMHCSFHQKYVKHRPFLRVSSLHSVAVNLKYLAHSELTTPACQAYTVRTRIPFQDSTAPQIALTFTFPVLCFYNKLKNRIRFLIKQFTATETRNVSAPVHHQSVCNLLLLRKPTCA